MGSIVRMRRLTLVSCLAIISSLLVADVAAGANPSSQATLQVALERLVVSPDGPPGAIAVIQHGDTISVVTAASVLAGTSMPPSANDHIRVASVAKAFSGATALALVAHNVVSLDDTIGRWLPGLPKPWDPVTLGGLAAPHERDTRLQRVFHVPFDFSLRASLQNPPPPEELLSYVEEPPCYNADKPLVFTPAACTNTRTRTT